MTATRPALRYHGGKWMLAPWIISHFPPHRIYVEPFGGGASVLLRKEPAYAEVYNDQWSEVVNVFRVMRDHGADLQRALILTPFAREEFIGTTEAPPADCPIERARRTVLRSFAGFGSASTNGEHATGFRANSNRSGTTPAHDWANYPSHIPEFIERFRGVTIENRPAIDVIQAHDREDCLHYVDPPYPHSTRNMDRGNAAYAVEMTDDDHRALAECLRNVRGYVVLSGYPCDLYDVELYADWHRVERAAFADGARERTEVIWLSPRTAAALNADQQRIF